LILVDTNVLFDVVTDSAWFAWSKSQLERAELTGPLGINDVIFAEFSVRYSTLLAVEDAVGRLELTLLPLPRSALFLAGKAFELYRRQRGATRTGVLADFFIGAHAACLDVPLLTRDPRRYRSYFPTVELIAP
jgi:predicted nucleic acid-binding protein